ncbi:hypothetical protein BDQ17DRAFT_1258231 [Cyathus striatus]|nr:hypothetical protein BDQ17DRAFT_1258231 [Cyathus striatus]
MPAAGLPEGHICRYDLVAKRPYDSAFPNKTPRLSGSAELEFLLKEGNILMWAGALLDATYQWVDSQLSENKVTTLPFAIPRLWFAKAAIATSTATISKPSGSSGTRTMASAVVSAYLLEEKIEGVFVKFLHNAQAGLPEKWTEEDHGDFYRTAEFLAFSQHVQYVLTGCLAYISDYQGDCTILMDLQIMTSPEYAFTGTLFGGGNLAEGFRAFPKQHLCNKYCIWFSLPSISPTEE